MGRTVLLVALTMSLPLARLVGQREGTALGLQGTAAYSGIWTTSPVEGTGWGYSGERFAGRVAIQIGPRLYAGVSIGSWQSSTGLVYAEVPQEGELTSLSTAVVGGAYVQFYPLPRPSLFVRTGVGLAQTTTYYPWLHDQLNVILADPATRGTLSFGAGADIGMGRHLALTAAADVTYLLGVDGGRELQSGLAASIGLTVR